MCKCAFWLIRPLEVDRIRPKCPNTADFCFSIWASIWVRANTFQWKVIETRLLAQMMCLLTVSVEFGHRNRPKYPKIVIFQIINIYEIFNTLGLHLPCGIAGLPQFEKKSRSFQKKVRDLSRTFRENPALFFFILVRDFKENIVVFSPQPTNLAEGYCYPPFRLSVC